ncbi:MAG: sigma-54-dependent Fis family transcriptional regulator [Gemmatimonadetes bacterium]|nr:sigma-54-dependent Fis family transcriptional regulator [Gemmatimonadota bacterium]
MKILIIDDEEIMRVSVQTALADAGHEAIACGTAEEGLAHLAEERFDAAVVDLKMPGMGGMEFLEVVRRDSVSMSVVIMTAYGTVETAVEAMKKGAYDYLTKPFDTDELILILTRLQEHREVVEENRRLKDSLQERHGFHRLVGKSSGMQKVYEALDVVCACDCAVLVTGETGTGKEMVARAIHFNSKRRSGPLVAVSCAALSTEILESELFGHVRGAFTGATADKKGRFELAHGGTLFLDEVDDIPLELQVKLLRVLENGAFERVGSGESVSVDVRIVAASKSDLRQRIEEGSFRDDLFYRLNQVPIYLPPLRERREDTPLLIEHFMQDMESPSRISSQAAQALMDYGWPGNIRELKHVLERLVMFHPQRIDVENLPEEVLIPPVPPVDGLVEEGSFEEAMSAAEKFLLMKALERTGGNQREAARQLGMPASSLRSRLERHKLI